MTRFFGVVVAILSFIAPASAGTFSGGAGDSARAACRADAYRFCSAVIKDTDKRRACMAAHRAQLSPGCQAVIGY